MTKLNITMYTSLYLLGYEFILLQVSIDHYVNVYTKKLMNV